MESIFTYTIGRCTVSTLVDTRGSWDASVIPGSSGEQRERYMPNGKYESQTNAFAIRTPDRIMVVDTGMGGNLFACLEELGIVAEAVDAVLLTHLHGDHIGGLQRDGEPLFPNALLYLAEQELATAGCATAATLRAYGEAGSKIRAFVPAQSMAGTEILPGIMAIAAFGHTRGHTAYMLESEGQRLFILSDLIHFQEIQFPCPLVTVIWDTDPHTAAESRMRSLAYVAAERIPVAGMHLASPSIGSVSAAGTGYRWTPLEG
jgi:glyoxylase-like metal-dependent hydrolase (beta-lactamase superfamily II)